ncbi:MAG: zinc ribbon domain-containing protein [Pyrinomonadaceae bacterium]
MICQNCQAQVDDDLIFCTNCGVRLAVSTGQTVLMNAPVVTKNAVAKPHKSSNLKWLALIVALIAVPASIFGVYLLINSSKNSQVSQNINKPNSPVQTPTRKTKTNQNSNADSSNANSIITNSENINHSENLSTPKNRTEVMNERIEIAPNTLYARQFKIVGDTSTFRGKIELLQGETYKGFVYLQSQYDEHFPDELYKMFIFGEEKKSDIKSSLIPQDYVLIFVNETEKPVIIQAEFWIEPPVAGL